ncbi:hypothetical protein SAMN05444747_11113 [Variovorax sp. OV329]|nr:hypothetical protein SAMN05444747_11113 [Variovorax sp. OV329]
MPFLAPSAARLPPLAYLLADQVAPRKAIARHLGLSFRTLQRYQASRPAATPRAWSSSPPGSKAVGGSPPCMNTPSTKLGTPAPGSEPSKSNASGCAA